MVRDRIREANRYKLRRHQAADRVSHRLFALAEYYGEEALRQLFRRPS